MGRFSEEWRVAAGVRARARQQWERARGHQTGPRTLDGKRRSAQRGMIHGGRSGSVVALQRWLASVNRLVRALGTG